MFRNLLPAASLIACVALLAPAAQAQQPDKAESHGSAKSAQRATGLSERARTAAQETLQATLFEVIALRYQVQQAHWNVVGKEFYQLHDLTGHFYEKLDDLIDIVGEQRLARGAPSTGVVGAVARNAKLAALPEGYLTSSEVLDTLAESYAILSANLLDRIDRLGERGDLVSQDVLIGVAAVVDKHLWMLRAHGGSPASMAER